MATTTTPRLKQKYRDEIAPKLRDEFKYENVMQIPGLVKIVVNMGVGDAARDSKLIEGAIRDLTTITGQKPAVTKARKSIAQFKLREGQPIGAHVTLRGDRMWGAVFHVKQYGQTRRAIDRRVMWPRRRPASRSHCPLTPGTNPQSYPQRYPPLQLQPATSAGAPPAVESPTGELSSRALALPATALGRVDLRWLRSPHRGKPTDSQRIYPIQGYARPCQEGV